MTSADVAAYVRVSSKAQNLATQRDAIERAARSRGDVVGTWYAEKASAKVMDRPEVERLRADVAAGRVRRLYAYRLDRLCRTGIADTLAFVELCRSSRCELVTCADGFDVNGPMAEVIIAVMAWAAKMERLAINERIAGARERIEGEGGTWGRPRRGTGKKDAARKIQPLDVDRAHALRSAGMTIRDVAAHLNVPRSTLARALSQKDAPPAASPEPPESPPEPDPLPPSR